MRKKSASIRDRKVTGGEGSSSRHISARIEELGDWRGEALAHVRALIREELYNSE